MPLAKAGKDRILDTVQRGKIDMPAFGGLHVITCGVTPHMRDAEPGAWPHDADGSGRRQWYVGAA